MDDLLEKFKLTKFEYKLPDVEVEKYSNNTLFVNNKLGITLLSQPYVDDFIKRVIEDRKKYLKVFDVLSDAEIKKLFNVHHMICDIKDVKDFKKVECFKWVVFVDGDYYDDFDDDKAMHKSLSENFGFNYYNSLTLIGDNGYECEQ